MTGLVPAMVRSAAIAGSVELAIKEVAICDLFSAPRFLVALILARRANVQGISVCSMQMFEAMNRAITANGIKPVIDKVFGFDEVQAAYKRMASGAHFGKIVIHVA
jgi:NADPH:quinone reductase-like Zn-dependent oxidoreductase